MSEYLRKNVYKARGGRYNWRYNPMIAAMVLGIISLIIPYVGILLAVAGIILAAMALNEIKEFGDQGRGMALAGLICAMLSRDYLYHT